MKADAKCPKCGGLLSVKAKAHCPDRTKPCGWVTCCGRSLAVAK